MRLYLFEKGKYLSDKIKILNHSDNLLEFEVNGRFKVMFYYKGHRLYHSCECKDGSLIPNKFCAHVISCVIYIAEHLNELGEKNE